MLEAAPEFLTLLDRSGRRVTTSLVDGLLKKLGPAAALQLT